MLLNGCLIYKECSRSILLALDFIQILCKGFLFRRRSSNTDCELHKPLDSYVFLCRKAEYRVNLTLADTDSKTLADFILGKFTCLEVFLHQSVVILGCTVNQSLAKLICLVFQVGRNLEVLAGTVLVGEMVIFHCKHINEAVE